MLSVILKCFLLSHRNKLTRFFFFFSEEETSDSFQLLLTTGCCADEANSFAGGIHFTGLPNDLLDCTLNTALQTMFSQFSWTYLVQIAIFKIQLPLP